MANYSRSVLLLIITMTARSVLTQNGGVDEMNSFTECTNPNVSCIPERCITAQQKYNESFPHYLQDIGNVLCADNQGPVNFVTSTFQLTGCPNDGYFKTRQSTEGVCFVSTLNGTVNLYLNASKMATGLHRLSCLIRSPTTILYTSAIILNNSAPFRDIQIYVDDILNDSTNTSTNSIVLTEGQKLVINARAVGNIDGVFLVGNISNVYANISDEDIEKMKKGFDCKTNILCKNDGRGRSQQCSKRAERSDNGTIQFFILNRTTNAMELVGEVNITVHINNSYTPTVTSEPTSTSPTKKGSNGISTGAIVGIVIPFLLVLLVFTIVALLFIYYRSNRSKDNNTPSLQLRGVVNPNDYKELSGVGNAPNTNQLNVLVYASDRHPLDSLINKLRDSNDFIVERLEETPSFQLNEYISELTFKLNHETVLIVGNSFPEGKNPDLHKAVKYFILKPFASSESKKWRIIHLIHVDGEVQSPHWDRLYDHVDMINYSNYDDSLENMIVKKLRDYIPSRTPSIHSNASDVQQALLNTVKKLDEDTERNHRELKNLVITASDHLAKVQEKGLEKLDSVGEKVEAIQTTQEARIQHDLTQSNEENS